MEKKEEFRKILWEIVQVYLLSKEGFLYSKYLHDPSTQLEKDFANSNVHIRMMRHMIWNFCAIELAKLVSNDSRDKLRIKPMLNELKERGEYAELNCPIEEIKYWESLLKNHKKVIHKINLFRNKVYAHTDLDRNKHINGKSIFFKEVEALNNSIEVILKGIYIHLYDTDFLFKTPGFESRKFNLLEILGSEQKNRISKLSNRLSYIPLSDNSRKELE